MNSRRPKIPTKTLLKLWVLAGGRCEFPGCNELVYKDNLTLSETNWSNISHIVAYSENGPRGSKELSSKLATEFSNLMLTCSKHSKLIDDKEHVAEYSREKLTAFKINHEKRIQGLTSIGNEFKTHALILQSNIGDNTVQINTKDVKLAIVEERMYPSEEIPFVIDLTNDTGFGTMNFYTAKAKQIEMGVTQFLQKFNSAKTIEHISIFSIALIPLLVYFGKTLGDKYPYRLYQYHRETENWLWQTNLNFPKYKPSSNNLNTQKKDVYIKISLSDSISSDKVASLNPDLDNIYEITINDPTPYYLINKIQLTTFKTIYRKMLNEIQTYHGKDCTIHLLVAAPAPIAVLCGMSLLPRKDPKIIVYDYDSVKKGFIKALTI